MKSIASRTALVVAGLVVALAGTLTLSAYAQPGPHVGGAAFFVGPHGPHMGHMLDRMLDVSKVLTPEQRKTLADKMKKRHDMMERHMREMQELEGKPKS